LRHKALRYNSRSMQVLQAGRHKLIYLELEPETVASIARQAGLKHGRATDSAASSWTWRPGSANRRCSSSTPADPANLGWFSRCQFYVDGRSGAVMQTPITLANKKDRSGKTQRHAVRLSITKETPGQLPLPGRQPLTEQVFYHLLFNFLAALTQTGVAVCGAGVVEPLAGRTESVGTRN